MDIMFRDVDESIKIQIEDQCYDCRWSNDPIEQFCPVIQLAAADKLNIEEGEELPVGNCCFYDTVPADFSKEMESNKPTS